MSLIKSFQKKMALGCDVTAVIVTDETVDTEAIFDTLWLTIFQFERRFSRFIPASELSIFNNNAGIKTPISVEFRDLLITAKKMAIVTDGLYNPFILPALQKAGYVQSFIDEYANDSAPNFSRRTSAPIEALEIFDDMALIPATTALDIGGIGKGYLADKLAQIIEEYPVDGYWFSLGGDVVAKGINEDGLPWTIAVQDAFSPYRRLSDNMLASPDSTTIASSGTIVRKGVIKNQNWHHLIDTRTGRPAETDILLATVLAQSTTLADVLAKCAVIVGSKDARNFLHKHGVSSYVLQVQTKDDAEVIINGAFSTDGSKKLEGALA